MNFKPQLERLVHRSIHLQINRKAMTDPKLTVHVKFLPSKPFSTSAHILVKRKAGGLWKFRVLFEALLPDFEDTITLRYEGEHTVSTSFELINPYEEQLAFEATISDDSAADFAVSPRRGLLRPKRDGSNTFTVTFRDANSRYNCDVEASLLIEVDDFVWLFRLVVLVHKYLPPQGGPRTDSWGKHHATIQPLKRNFLH